MQLPPQLMRLGGNPPPLVAKSNIDIQRESEPQVQTDVEPKELKSLENSINTTSINVADNEKLQTKGKIVSGNTYFMYFLFLLQPMCTVLLCNIYN